MRTLPTPSSTPLLATDCSGKFCGPGTNFSICFSLCRSRDTNWEIICREKITQGLFLVFFFLHFLLVVENLPQLCTHKSYPFYQNSLEFVFSNLNNKLVFNTQTKTQAPHKQNQTTKTSTDFDFSLKVFLSCYLVTALVCFCDVQFPVSPASLLSAGFIKHT